MARRRRSDAFDVHAKDEHAREVLAHELCYEIEGALSARADVIASGGLIDLVDWFYEQGKNRDRHDGADLTSYIITENVDALRARLMRTIFGVQPFCTVDAWGSAKEKAAAVEEFHEWQITEERLPQAMAKYIHGALLEDCAIIEVRPKVETRKVVREIDAAIETTETGEVVFGEHGGPNILVDEQGEPVEAQPGAPSAKVRIEELKTQQLGPEYDVISMRDFVYLPGHAKCVDRTYGYAYRTFRRTPEVDELVRDGIYDAAAVEKLGTADERTDERIPTSVQSVPANDTTDTAELELWQISLKRDLDGDGREEWYVATVSLKSRQLLRLKLDRFAMRVGKPRCVPFIPFPRRDSVYGYSYAGNKLITLAEEHTALRNMAADRSALASLGVVKQVAGGLWDPDAEPLGPGNVITVRDHREVEQLAFSDVPQSVIFLLRDIMQAKERVGGLADVSIGVSSTSSRTATEQSILAAGSTVRVEEALGHLRESISDIMQLRHAIWQEVFESQPTGMELPSLVADAIQQRGGQLENAHITAELLKGKFQFRPYGSVETADPRAIMASFAESLKALSQIAQVLPAMQHVMTNPEVAKAVLEQWARVFKVRDPLPFLRAFDAGPQAPPAMQAPGAPMTPQAGPPGAPGGPGQGGGVPPEIQAILAQMGAGGALGQPPGPPQGPQGPPMPPMGGAA